MLLKTNEPRLFGGPDQTRAELGLWACTTSPLRDRFGGRSAISSGSNPTAMSRRPWRLRRARDARAAEPASEAREEGRDAFCAALDVDGLVANLLWERGVRTRHEAQRFLEPKLAHLSSPFELPGMDNAADRLARAITDDEHIAICGDYDVDGMTATALLVRFFNLLGANVSWSIPLRDADGYGLRRETIDELKAREVNVAVTVDNGISAHDAVDAATQHGIDVVITDHHPPGNRLPTACAIVNPHLAADGSIQTSDSSNDAPPLCGCGVAFKLAWGIADRLRGGVLRSRAAEFKRFMKHAVGLVAIATVADVVPLHGENRVLVANGLKALRESPHAGVQALLRVSDVGELPITAEDIGFRLGPRLNAAGRLSQPELVIELLVSDDPDVCERKAQALDQANTKRREIEQGVLKQAEHAAQTLLAEHESLGSPRKSLVLWGDDWHVGVIGIVAARLVDRFGLPTAVVGMQGDEGRGSCRTPPGYDLHHALAACHDVLAAHGGHAMAAGLEVARSQLDAFRAAFERAVTRQAEQTEASGALYFDAESSVDHWHVDTVEALHRLAPFGQGNPEPVFVLKGAELAGKPKLMGKNATHLSFALKQTGGAIRVVGWRQAALFDVVGQGQPLDVAVVPYLNHWRGMTTAELRLIDVRPTNLSRTKKP